MWYGLIIVKPEQRHSNRNKDSQAGTKIVKPEQRQSSRSKDSQTGAKIRLTLSFTIVVKNIDLEEWLNKLSAYEENSSNRSQWIYWQQSVPQAGGRRA
jgi:hypothetical protein